MDQGRECRGKVELGGELCEHRGCRDNAESVCFALQWNISNQDTNGAEESVLFRLKCMQEW